MADAIPTPADRQSKTQSTVVVQAPMSQWTALKEAGWWTQYDWIMLSLIGFLWVTAFYWKMFGNPDGNGLVALLLINVSLLLVWLISLVFRCSFFVLRLHAEIATLPEQSARIAVAFLAGQQPPSTK